MYRPIARLATLWLISLWIVACTRPSPTTEPLALSTPEPIEVPVTVEVTRIITQPVVIEVTPTPVTPCSVASLEATTAIPIGIVLPLSLPGNMAAGFAMQTAASLAVQEINDNGGVEGRPLTLLVADSAGDPVRGRLGAERLILDDCAVGIVAADYSNVVLPAAEAVRQSSTPLIVTKATADEVTASAFPEVFRIAPAYSSLAEMPARWLTEVGDFNQDGRIVAGVITASHDEHTQESVMAAFASASLEAHHFSVDLPATDFSSAVARIVTMEQVPDALFIYIHDADALALTTQILAAGIGPQKSTLLVLHHAGLDSSQFWQVAPGGLGTVVFRLGPWPTTVTPLGQAFALAYGQFAGHWPEAHAFATYDAVHLLADAIRRAGSLQGPALVAALEQTDIELASGHYSFPYGSHSASGADSALPYMWHQWPGAQSLYLQYTDEQQPAADMAVLWPSLYRTVDGPLAHIPRRASD